MKQNRQDKSQDKTDEELVGLARQEPDYFLYLMRRYEGKLTSFIMRISGFNKDDAEDVLQEVFIKVYYNLNDFDDKLKFSSWIYRITRNQTISQARKKKVRPVLLFEPEDAAELIGDIDLPAEVDQEFLKKKINRALAAIGNKYSEVLVLKYLEDKDYKEIADILKKPMGTVGTLLNRAKKKMKQELQKYD